MDLDPFEPVGINSATARFLDIFLLHCLARPSPPDTPDELAALARNQHRTAARGREPGLRLEFGGAEVPLTERAERILHECTPIAATLDEGLGGSAYREALAITHAGLRAPATLPSARVLEATIKDHRASHIEFVRAQAEQARNALLALPWPAEQQAHFEALTRESMAAQAAIEAADTMPFEIYRQEYLDPRRLGLHTVAA